MRRSRRGGGRPGRRRAGSRGWSRARRRATPSVPCPPTKLSRTAALLGETSSPWRMEWKRWPIWWGLRARAYEEWGGIAGRSRSLTAPFRYLLADPIATQRSQRLHAFSGARSVGFGDCFGWCRAGGRARASQRPPFRRLPWTRVCAVRLRGSPSPVPRTEWTEMAPRISHRHIFLFLS